MSNDLVVGAWRNGLGDHAAEHVGEVDKRRTQGFRQLAYESTVAQLSDLLDSYDTLAAELLSEQCKCAEKKNAVKAD